MRTTLQAAISIAACVGGVACGPPSPERLVVRSDQTALGARIELDEGDLLVVDVDPVDGDESMDLCVNGTSEGAVDIGRVREQCQRFVVLGTTAGAGTIRFEVRGAVTEIAVDVVGVR
jgi:hypothetical protein